MVSDSILKKINNILEHDDLEGLYYTTMKEESNNRQILMNIEQKYPNRLNEENITHYIDNLSIDNDKEDR